jgi:hypothetical protein
VHDRDCKLEWLELAFSMPELVQDQGIDPCTDSVHIKVVDYVEAVDDQRPN